MNQILLYSLWTLSGLAIILIAYFFVGFTAPASNITWGVNFSVKQAEFLKLDSKETYLAILDDLKVKNIKISVHWDLIEKNNNQYDFSELDWQVSQAESRGVNVILSVGMKTPRWPECHLPGWARDLNKDQQQDEILNMLKEAVIRYRDRKAISAWQVENEPLLNFGACPWADERFFRKEVSLVKSLDSMHPVIITDSGELSFWIKGTDIGDILGITTYTRIWQQNIRQYIGYPLPPVFYHRKAMLVGWIFHKPVIGVELQAEPWCANSIMNSSLEEQAITMNFEQFKHNVNFARDTGIDTFYFWGAEWWYYMKNTYNDPGIWNEAKKLFAE